MIVMHGSRYMITKFKTRVSQINPTWLVVTGGRMRGYRSTLERTLRYNTGIHLPLTNPSYHTRWRVDAAYVRCRGRRSTTLRIDIRRKGERHRMRGWGRFVVDEAELPFLGVLTWPVVVYSKQDFTGNYNDTVLVCA